MKQSESAAFIVLVDWVVPNPDNIGHHEILIVCDRCGEEFKVRDHFEIEKDVYNWMINHRREHVLND